MIENVVELMSGMPEEAVAFIVSALPIAELRGGIPVALKLGMQTLQTLVAGEDAQHVHASRMDLVGEPNPKSVQPSRVNTPQNPRDFCGFSGMNIAQAYHRDS